MTMASVSSLLKGCGVKIVSYVSGTPSFGSGVIYTTPNFCEYNYVLTAKHIFQEDPQTIFNIEKVNSIEVLYSDNDHYSRLEYINNKDIRNKLIWFDEDLSIVIVNKNKKAIFETFVVSDQMKDNEIDFIAWATFSANPFESHLFELKRNDIERKRFKLNGIKDPQSLSGISGAGIFSANKSVLYGVIYKYPNKDFELETVDCTQITFAEINSKLKSISRIELDTQTSGHKRIIESVAVDIHQAMINGVCLDLELARKRLEADIKDDWYHDPLKYIDLLNQDYLFRKFQGYFGKNKYKASLAEQFFVPKKTFTLRQALISPFIDRIMYFAVVGELADKLDKAMIPGVYSARYNRWQENQLIINGVEQWKKMKYQLADCVEHYGCVIEVDLLNFYDNINKKHLYEKILRICETPNEKNAAKLLYEILKKLTNKDIGLPQNSDASSLLASFYLNQIDVFMQHQAPDYYRFMDDIRIFCKDRFEARKLLQTMETELRRCHLSVNSQKTNIIEFANEPVKKQEYFNLFDIELNKISRLRKSTNYANKNQAFHLSVKMLEVNLLADANSSNDFARRLNYALNTIALLGKKGIWLYSDLGFKTHIKKAITILSENPWITPQVCNVLNLIPKECIEEDYYNAMAKIVLEEKYNTYSLQVYQIWMLLAKHKHRTKELVHYAVKSIERNDETIRPAIAAMIIYMGSVDEKYRKVILRKYGENFTHGYFQNRIALISLRSFPTNIIPKKYINPSLLEAHEFLYRFKDKDLVYILGATEEKDNDNDFEQLYSI